MNNEQNSNSTSRNDNDTPISLNPKIKTNNNNNKEIPLPQFFDLFSSITIENPFSYSDAITSLKLTTDNELLSNINNFILQENEFLCIDNEIDYKISSLNIMTSKLSSNKLLNLVKLVDIGEYINPISPDAMKIEFIDDLYKKGIFLKCKVDFNKISSNIFNNMCKVSEFKTAMKLVNNVEEHFSDRNEQLEFQIFIQSNSVNKILYSDNTFLFDLQYPPIYKTNFLLEKGGEYNGIERREYENVIFPFRNFDNETANLKYRRMFFMIKEDNSEDDVNDEYKRENENNFLPVRNRNKDTILGSLKTMFPSGVKFSHVSDNLLRYYNDENEMKQKENLILNWELSDYFDIINHKEVYDAYTKINFINKDDKIPSLNIIKFEYQLFAIVSENILSYYNAIDFINNFLFPQSTSSSSSYCKLIFSQCENNNNDFPSLFNESLSRILDTYQNIGTEFSLSEFTTHLKEKFDSLYTDYLTKGLAYVTRPSRNKTLIRIQRIIVTPTYTLFTPYVLDQGNRILREFILHPFLSMICVFKMDDFNEGKWNNKFLIEYIKYTLSHGIYLADKLYTFFNFSQSQFRNMSCWLLTNPNEILPLTGDYSKIKIVAKYGARISQTLTTTRKTIIIKKEGIKYIDDIVIRNENGKVKYTFSDGVGKISYTLAKSIAQCIHLPYVPACFQGRFLGCKGVWTTIYDDYSECIYIRPSQNKFKVKESEEQYFELCDYSRYIQAYLNRQIILLLSALSIKDEIFHKKLDEYRNSLEDEKFILSLIHYEEWNGIFNEMYKNGITMKNDRLVKSLVDNNKDILYNDLKNKARIYIKDSAYVIGIMDEYGILEYGEAFLRIKRRNFDMTLDQYCTVAKCPCLHPGDIRLLRFKKYNANDIKTIKYKVFDNYCNVLIFPQKGKRPHPNEASGSDLDGDNYFVFYDKDLIPDENNIAEPMNYNLDSQKIKEKNGIKIKHIIKYFAEYINLNNLGIIGDAHLAMCDQDKQGANGAIPIGIAEKFSRAVDAPKTGEKVFLTPMETPKKFPHYMEKKRNSYISTNILGQLYDKIEDYKIKLVQDKKVSALPFYNNNLLVNSKWEKFCFIALIFYKEYFEEFVKMLKKNEIKSESVLLTGNNVDNEYSVFSKKKHNYDLRERISGQMVEIFRKFKNKFAFAMNNIFGKYSDILGELNDELFFKNNAHQFATACYMISYNFREYLFEGNRLLEEFKDNFINEVIGSLYKEEEYSNIKIINEYESMNIGFGYRENYFGLYEDIYAQKRTKIEKINEVITLFNNTLKNFEYTCIKGCDIPERPERENQFRILSFPWCMCGKLLSKINFLKQ